MFSKIFDAIALVYGVVFIGAAAATLVLVVISAVTGQSPIDFSGDASLMH
ncbi:hypothetical protein [Leucobacter sp. USHLN153]